MSPTARSLAQLRQEGWTPDVVERFIAGARIRRDFLNFADIIAVREDFRGALAIQACVTGDQATRLAKIHAEPRAQIWLAAGNEIQVWGWALRGARGARKRWTLTRTTAQRLSPPAWSAPTPGGTGA